MDLKQNWKKPCCRKNSRSVVAKLHFRRRFGIFFSFLDSFSHLLVGQLHPHQRRREEQRNGLSTVAPAWRIGSTDQGHGIRVHRHIMLILPLRFVAFSQNGLGKRNPPNFSPTSISSFYPATNQSYPFFACSKRNAHHQNLIEREQRNHANKMGNGTRNTVREKTPFETSFVKKTPFEAPSGKKTPFETSSVKKTSFETPSGKKTPFETSSVKKTSFETPFMKKTPFETPSVKKTPFDTPFVVKIMWNKRWRKYTHDMLEVEDLEPNIVLMDRMVPEMVQERFHGNFLLANLVDRGEEREFSLALLLLQKQVDFFRRAGALQQLTVQHFRFQILDWLWQKSQTNPISNIIQGSSGGGGWKGVGVKGGGGGGNPVSLRKKRDLPFPDWQRMQRRLSGYGLRMTTWWHRQCRSSPRRFPVCHRGRTFARNQSSPTELGQKYLKEGQSNAKSTLQVRLPGCVPWFQYGWRRPSCSLPSHRASRRSNRPQTPRCSRE